MVTSGEHQPMRGHGGIDRLAEIDRVGDKEARQELGCSCPEGLSLEGQVIGEQLMPNGQIGRPLRHPLG